MNFMYLLIVILVIIISMTLHEAMHAYASYWLGDDTAKSHGRLSLNPIKHIDPFLTLLLPITLAMIGAPVFGGAKPVPFNPNRVRFGEWGVMLVALAGPLTNFIIAFLTFGIWALIGASNQSVIGQILIVSVSVNLGFFVFNMIPFPPLDGSRVLYALAPEFVQRAMETMEKFGVVFIFAIVLLAGNAISTLMTGSINFFFSIFGHIFGL